MDTASECYDITIATITPHAWLDSKSRDNPAFGGARHKSLAASDREDVAAQLMPALRGFVSDSQHMVGHFNDSDTVLEFVNAEQMEALAALGTSCPDHFLRTKIRPLVLDFDPNAGNIDQTLESLPRQISYRDDYTSYYEAAGANSPEWRTPMPSSI